jgi:hypothetical protein
MGLLAGEPWEEETFHFHYHVNTIKLTHFNLGGMGEIEANNTSEKEPIEVAYYLAKGMLLVSVFPLYESIVFAPK